MRAATIHLVNWPLHGNEGLRLILGNLPVRFYIGPSTIAYVQTAPLSGRDLFIIDRNDSAAYESALARFPAARVVEWRPHAIHGASLWLVFVSEPRSARAPSTG